MSPTPRSRGETPGGYPNDTENELYPFSLLLPVFKPLLVHEMLPLAAIRLVFAKFGKPLFPYLFSYRGTELVRNRKLISPWKRPAGVDEHSSGCVVALLAFFRWHTRV